MEHHHSHHSLAASAGGPWRREPLASSHTPRGGLETHSEDMDSPGEGRERQRKDRRGEEKEGKRGEGRDREEE